jgi:hypothetical protein
MSPFATPTMLSYANSKIHRSVPTRGSVENNEG